MFNVIVNFQCILFMGTRQSIKGVRKKTLLDSPSIYKTLASFRSYSDTVFGLSSGHGKCGVAVVRVSGSKAGRTVQELCRLNAAQSLIPRKAHLCKLYDPQMLHTIDKGLVLWFPGPHSFTGEDLAEFHVHGGPAVVAAMTTALSSIPGVRYAEAGDFTKRAFMNGKLDLTEVEGLGDLIHAETEAQRKQALRQMDGDLSKLYKTWRTNLMKITANVEAYIDFGEDENIEDDVLEQVTVGVTNLIGELKKHLADNRQGERLRDGVHVAILGKPNVGKSSLLNAICQRPAAIVSPVAGTTRDVVETALNIGGYPVLLSDTAGLRETVDVVEKEGVRRALSRAQQSDIKVLVVDSGCQSFHTKDHNLLSFAHQNLKELGILTSYEHANTFTSDNVFGATGAIKDMESSHHLLSLILVFNKCDLLSQSQQLYLQEELKCKGISHSVISCETGEGIDDFIQVLKNKVIKMCGNPLAGNPSLTQARHRNHLKLCHQHLCSFQQCIEQNDIVIAAQNLRYALSEFSKITGKITSEDILDVIFRDFCIGK